MSRERARAALRGERVARLVTGLAWVPQPVLDEMALPGTSPCTLCSLAAGLGVDLAFVAAEQPWAPEAVAGLHTDDVAAVWTLGGPFGRLAAEMGWTEALAATAGSPGTLAFPLDRALSLTLVEARAGIAVGADAVLVADELAGASGPLLSPDYALEVLLPLYRRIAALAREAELPAVFHSDGDIRALLPALARAGFSAVHLAPGDEAAFRVSAMAAHDAGLVVLGGIEAAALSGRARALGAEAGVLARTGGRIICDDGGITAAAEVIALGASLDAARAAHADRAEDGTWE